MKTKRILSFVCVLALVLTMCSVFSFAVAPEAETEAPSEVIPRAVQTGKVTKTGTYIYNLPSTSSGYKYPSPIPKNSTVYVYALVTSNGVQFYDINWQSGTAHTGYVLKSHITLS